jgi:predicted alpha/beta hydrolase
VPITFPGLVSMLSTAFRTGNAGYDWLTDAKLKRDFEAYLSELETRRVLYTEWRYEDINAVLGSLDDILRQTRTLRSAHSGNAQASGLLRSLISQIQKGIDTIRGCNMHSREGEFMAYRALLRIRTEMARVLAIFCGMLDVDPGKSELRKFIMDMAVVRPRA